MSPTGTEHRSLLRDILALAVPIAVGGAVQTSYHLINTFWVGRPGAAHDRITRAGPGDMRYHFRRLCSSARRSEKVNEMPDNDDRLAQLERKLQYLTDLSYQRPLSLEETPTGHRWASNRAE